MHEDEAALLRTVHQNPRDATPRLVLADYYDDNNRPQEAAMHRYIAEPTDRHRDLFTVAYNRGVLSAHFALSNYVYDRVQHHHDAGNLREGTDRYATQNAWTAVRTAHWAATNASQSGAMQHHSSAASRHAAEAAWFRPQENTGMTNPPATDDAVAELHTLHTAAAKLHQYHRDVLGGRA